MQGSCLCGTIKFATSGPVRQVIACHCTQCRKSSGHYVAASQAANCDLDITGIENLTWFASSNTAKRGFCSTCGCPMFWRQNGAEETSIMAGAIDGPTGLHIAGQMFAEAKGDYYLLPTPHTAGPR